MAGNRKSRKRYFVRGKADFDQATCLLFPGEAQKLKERDEIRMRRLIAAYQNQEFTQEDWEKLDGSYCLLKHLIRTRTLSQEEIVQDSSGDYIRKLVVNDFSEDLEIITPLLAQVFHDVFVETPEEGLQLRPQQIYDRSRWVAINTCITIIWDHYIPLLSPAQYRQTIMEAAKHVAQYRLAPRKYCNN